MTTYQTLIEAKTVFENLENDRWVIVDCRFNLEGTGAGARAYLTGHIPGAVYAHLDDDLSGPPATDEGRHPLPTPAAMTLLFGRLGIRADSQVVVYDDARGVFASRLWWMLRYMGHDAVALLNGGWPAWLASGYPSKSGEESNPPGLFTGEPRRERLVVLAEVVDAPLLIDARAEARYRGEEEPLDPRAGHIPGARNYYYDRNYREDGLFLRPEILRDRLKGVLGETAADDAVFYCGSGVSACVNLLALRHAGLGDGRLYVGSWSEWSKDPDRPAATTPPPAAAS